MTPADFLDRVFCKSCSDLSGIPDGAINCIVTSPPYETQRDYSDAAENHGNYRGDEFITEMREPIRELFRVLKDDGSAFINFVPGRKDGFLSSTLYTFPMLLEEVGFKVVQVLSWVKTNSRPTADPRVLKSAAEPIYHVVRGRDFSVNKDAIRRPSLWAAKDHRAWKYNPLGADGGNWLCPALDRLNKMSIQDVLGAVLDPEGNVLPLKKTQNQTTLHPATMPDELADWLILYGSQPGGVLLDPWAGSGTSLCRAKALGRRYVGYELVPGYAALCDERLAQVQFGEALDPAGSAAAATKPKLLHAPAKPVENATKLLARRCLQCDAPFTTKKKGQVFCCSRCRYTHHNRHNTRAEERKNDGTQADVA